jgi:hypothetical protein
MAAQDRPNSIALDDVIAASASGVLRALDARREGQSRAARITALDLVRNGFVVDLRITAGGFPGPWLEKVLQGQQQALAMREEGGEQ